MSKAVPESKIKRVSRVTWPEIECAKLERALASPPECIKRICIQCVQNSDNKLFELIRFLKKTTNLPISVSAYVKSRDHAAELFDSGIQRLGIAIDAANEAVYKKVKKGDFFKRRNLVIECAELFPGRVTTHIIAGLGESEYDVFSLVKYFYAHKTNVALFAFTPVSKTEMACRKQPEYASYRRLQMVRYIFHNSLEGHFDFLEKNDRTLDIALKQKLFPVFSKGILNFFNKDDREVFKIDALDVLKTSGCPGCNRPFYNESPGQRPYNFAFLPDENIVLSEFRDMNVSMLEKMVFP
jgi:biotin synthase